jgi:tetratricopeptide (TPR) repeat protein
LRPAEPVPSNSSHPEDHRAALPAWASEFRCPVVRVPVRLEIHRLGNVMAREQRRLAAILAADAALLDTATELDPNLFMGWEFRGWTALINGERRALEYFESALRLSPLDPRLFSAHSGIGNAHFLAGRYDEALAWAAKALRQYQHLPAIGVLVASQALTGRVDDARSSYEMHRHRFPGARLSNIRRWMTLRRDDDIQKFIEGFRLAGMPE